MKHRLKTALLVVALLGIAAQTPLSAAPVKKAEQQTVKKGPVKAAVTAIKKVVEVTAEVDIKAEKNVILNARVKAMIKAVTKAVKKVTAEKANTRQKTAVQVRAMALKKHLEKADFN